MRFWPRKRAASPPPDLTTREGLVAHLQVAHGYPDSETDPDPETAATGAPGTFGIVRLGHPVWTSRALHDLHDSDHYHDYPDTGTPVEGHAHHHA